MAGDEICAIFATACRIHYAHDEAAVMQCGHEKEHAFCGSAPGVAEVSCVVYAAACISADHVQTAFISDGGSGMSP